MEVPENKAGAAAHFIHPMLCATSDGEPLSIMLRPGNAAANNIADHIDVLDAAVAQLPEAVAAGHCASGGAPAPRRVQLRVDAAGCSTQIAQACRQRNIEFFMTARSNDGVTTAIDHNRFDRDTWQPALGSDGEPSKRAQVADSESVDLAGPSAPVARREPLHRGAQRTLFDPSCATAGSAQPRTARRPHAAHARIEFKDSGLKRMPFNFDANAAWTHSSRSAAGEMVPTTAPAGATRPQTRGTHPPE